MRTTDVTCDGPGCGYVDGAIGGTEWIVVKWGKRKYDFCGGSCLQSWAEKQPRQASMELVGATEG